MDWETLLGFTGLYILTVGVFFHHYIMSKRMMGIIKDNQRILSLMGILMDTREEKKGKGGGESTTL
jgi:hypothetical protein